MKRKDPPRRPNSQLLPTLFDRLRDDAPHQQAENADAYTVTRSQMSEIVRRDLAHLLNTTNREDEIDRERHAYAARSTVNYGVPPLAGTHAADRDWPEILGMIRRAIEDFEPRLIPGDLVVRLLDKKPSEHEYNVLRFEIRGRVHMNPYPMAFTAQSSLDLETRSISIKSFQAS
ncbi:type VI secretion system baseplate subunit TssE [Cupriavidus pauculus]|uniref:type VI secretion system baseplate subunit TssE n=1 Tax=Cupriavidus pauculus TaxID=82633 RepID=UPI000781D968|nr:type VI secretion system baseplate subunit TssE [Cupriavidus pauculus]MBY4731117.1 type VI secretion system baseplate subunit TssE [Cupriavidus pauculus]